ncbi:hypothetical protein, partial [Yersinia similis]|uniref:hypothetical protein n=1 Tax=Yersinia similis TaxID=367190 RepID=UPI001E55A091
GRSLKMNGSFWWDTYNLAAKRNFVLKIGQRITTLSRLFVVTGYFSVIKYVNSSMLIKLAIAEIKIALYYYPDAPPPIII